MKRLAMITVTLCMLFISACGGPRAWEDEQLDESDISTRILADHVKADWKLAPPPAGEGPGNLIQVTFRLQDGSPVEAFELTHEKLLHLIIVSKDLSYFNHVHPEYKGGGVFEVANDFPAGGEYRMIAEFKPAGGDAMTKLAWLEVEGEPALSAPVVLTDPLEATADGKRVTLRISSLAPDEESVLTFHVEDEVSGRPITDLEPYLGAIGHVVILSEDGERYVHAHAGEDQGKLIISLPEKRYNEVSIRNEFGSVDVTDISANRVEIKLSAGDIRLSGVSGELALETETGMIAAEGVTLDQNIFTRTSVVDIEVRFSASPDSGSIRARSTLGDILVDIEGVQYSVNSGTHKAGRFASEGHLLEAVSEIGSIRVGILPQLKH